MVGLGYCDYKVSLNGCGKKKHKSTSHDKTNDNNDRELVISILCLEKLTIIWFTRVVLVFHLTIISLKAFSMLDQMHFVWRANEWKRLNLPNVAASECNQSII